ncbi:hypothetical protein B0T11DRAFT_68931 [Plectosphaerella cucumerina]|uniref:Uncharacterized protein n=1 Tax=Plectosphaerella cucumerina TaxID=40658 RepID=A0A8K0X733_9PEZI|nr:hypothetical protein B0T11DRAFT_68931 [Plectosphaerella cucumerina]
MEEEPEGTRKIKALLAPYTKSREEVAYVRRILALHLQQQCQTDSLPVPLSLLSPSDHLLQQPRSHGQDGIFERYLQAAAENVKAQQQYSSLRQGFKSAAPPPPTGQKSDTNPLEEHLAQAKLRKKQDRLQILHKYFSRLSDHSNSPQAGDLEVVFQDSHALPEVPKSVLSSFASAASEEKSDLNGVLDEMERVVLRTKLVLRREEQLLQDARERADHAARGITDEARLQALNQTRNELIAWIETELGKASNDDDDDAVGGKTQREPDTDISQQLDDIKGKYDQYLETRKSLLGLISQTTMSTQPSLPPPTQTSNTEEETPQPLTHQLVPYLETLLELSRKQKGMIQHKSHLTSTLGKEARETRKALNYLAEESQLLPRHPMPGSSSKGSFEEHMAGAAAEKPNVAKQVKPWVYAADSAKIATFEVVAEKVEEGQLALEDSMKTLYEIDELLGRQKPDEGQGQAGEEDVWLTEARTAGSSAQAQQRKPAQASPGDPWSALLGDLGLIGEESYRR